MNSVELWLQFSHFVLPFSTSRMKCFVLLSFPEPVIKFTKERVFVVGPAVAGANSEALIPVKKTGDPTVRSKVRVYTLDGSAKAGRSYQPMTEVIPY